MMSIETLKELFGDYRAEWAGDRFDTLFVEPPYFAKLQSIRPCFLIGGRGTGKTVSLKSLRYDSVDKRIGQTRDGSTKLPYLSVYIRLNKNRVRAFRSDPSDDPLERNKLFAHYFNLLVVRELANLTKYLQANEEISLLSDQDFDFICSSLNIDNISSIDALQVTLKQLLIKLEVYINNPFGQDRPTFSIAESPVKLFAEAIHRNDPVEDRPVFICIDEYENLLEYQQSIVNTYIKHAEAPLSYKVGVRRYGHKTKTTTDNQDLLTTPEDYAKVDLSNSEMTDFARKVVQHRLERARKDGLNLPDSSNFLPSLTLDEEAEMLGAKRYAKEVTEIASKQCQESVANYVKSLTILRQYFIRYWKENTNEDIPTLAKDWFENPQRWQHRINNYGYSSLFWLSKGRKGARIRKYYAGEKTFLKMCSGNIRYYLELIDESINEYLGELGDEINEVSSFSIPPIYQTQAAKRVAKRRLDQLEGLSSKGMQLKRLVLGIGKVFFEFARSPTGHSPEITSFILKGEKHEKEEIQPLLQEGVGHLALEAYPRTKPTSELEVKDNEYRLHPIYCPFFEYSYRKKRRTRLSAADLLEVSSPEDPRMALKRMMGDKVESASIDEMPRQLGLFSAFYRGN